MKKNFTKLKKIHDETNHANHTNQFKITIEPQKQQNQKNLQDSMDTTPFEVKYDVTCKQIENFQLHVTAGEHTVKLDEPHSVAGDNTAMNAVQMLISAFASCLETNWFRER